MTDLEERVRERLLREASQATPMHQIYRGPASLPNTDDRNMSGSWRFFILTGLAVATAVVAVTALADAARNDGTDSSPIGPASHTSSVEATYTEEEITAAADKVYEAAREGKVPSPNVAGSSAYGRGLLLEMRPKDLQGNIDQLQAAYEQIAGMPVDLVKGQDQPPQPAVP